MTETENKKRNTGNGFCKEHTEHSFRLGNVEGRMDKIDVAFENRKNKVDTILDKIRNRPPVWVTFLFMFMTGVVGWLISKV